MKESEIALEIATDKTLNNATNISDKLPEEIIKTYRDKIVGEIKSEYDQRELKLIDQARIAEEEKKRSIQQVFEKDEQFTKVIDAIKKASIWDSRILCLFVSIVFFTPPGVLLFSDYIGNTAMKLTLGIISFILGSISAYYGISIKGLGDDLFKRIMKIKKKRLGIKAE